MNSITTIRRRKAATQQDRLTPCQFCDYPISERHHALPVSTFGENICTLQLCANCHELYHIVQAIVLNKSEWASRLLATFKDVYGEDDIRLQNSYHFIAAAINITNGTV